MSLKEFMANHITPFWPCVFRDMAQDWQAVAAWKEDGHLERSIGQ